MSDTICVLALDAADYELAQLWDTESLLLDRWQPLESYAHSKKYPYTPEVWATVATGVGPEEHGIGKATQEVEWDNPLLRLGSRITQYLPTHYRRKLGQPFRRMNVGRSFQRVADHLDYPFESVLGWPGIADCQHLEEMWYIMDLANDGLVSKERFNETVYRIVGQDIGFLESMGTTDMGLVGAHTHVIDMTGHIYAERGDRYRDWYEWTDTQVSRLREACDSLVVLSDHGMQSSALNDEHPGFHSWRGFIAAQGIDEPLPESVYDVRSFLERVKPDHEARRETLTTDTTAKQLEALGYK